jgi:hypothetical protein
VCKSEERKKRKLLRTELDERVECGEIHHDLDSFVQNEVAF